MPTAYIGMGGNLASSAGSPEATLAAAATRLESFGPITGRSSLYSTEPVGFLDQPRFVNAVLALATNLAPQDLLRALLAIESEFGRDRASSFPNGPRTLDLDILLFDNLQVHEPGLIIPHPRLAQRAFVLVPLAEIAHHILDVQTETSVGQLLDSLRLHAGGVGDAVVPIQSSLWRAGAGRDGLYPGHP
jgi:2-amino-4-hydroxy-6-hydroxymethyldihydropteridine diphosphokinase